MIFKKNYYCCLGIVFIIFSGSASCQKITDTIFYNQDWGICEKPIAAYYRLGTLAIDSFWIYTGRVRDYTIKGYQLMEGEYSIDGFKNGRFIFYYPDGKIKASGLYKDDKLYGEWIWNYPNGNEWAIINSPSDEKQFQFVKYRDANGKSLLENGLPMQLNSSTIAGIIKLNFFIY